MISRCVERSAIDARLAARNDARHEHLRPPGDPQLRTAAAGVGLQLVFRGANRLFGERLQARVGAEAMNRVAGVTSNARSTAADVKDLADSVAIEAEGLETQVRQFLTNVQAA